MAAPFSESARKDVSEYEAAKRLVNSDALAKAIHDAVVKGVGSGMMASGHGSVPIPNGPHAPTNPSGAR
jgi:hypothetical protein